MQPAHKVTPVVLRVLKVPLVQQVQLAAQVLQGHRVLLVLTVLPVLLMEQLVPPD